MQTDGQTMNHLVFFHNNQKGLAPQITEDNLLYQI